MTKPLVDTLATSNLFEGIATAEIEMLLSGHNYDIREYNSDDVFALTGSKVNHLMIVIEGGLNTRMVSDSGKYIQIEKIEKGKVVAPAMLFATRNEFPVNVIPEDETSVFFMHRESFLKAMQENEKLLMNFIRSVSDINRFLSSRIRSLSLKSIRGKLSEYLLLLSGEQGNKNQITIPLTRQELADKFAVSRQSLIRSLTELEEEGLISVEGREVTIIRHNLLELEE